MKDNRVVVVTGSSAGVGRAIARAFGARGCRVGLIARTAEALDRAAEEIRSSGGEALPLPLDVADADAVQRAADQVVAKWGRIDVWVNDAMVSVFSPISEMKPSEYRRVTEVNYLGFIHGTLAALSHMRPRDSGVIIQIGSALGDRSIPLQSAYCGSKAAIRGFTDSLRCELKHDKSHVEVCLLRLPAVNTPQFEVVRNRLPGRPRPVGTIYQPEIIARAAVHVSLHPVRELWIGSNTIKAIIGQYFIPGLLDRYLGKIAWDGQMTREPARPRPDDVDQPLAGDRGAHGRFDREARRRSPELWARTHRGLLAALGLSALTLGALTLVRAGR